MKKWGLFFGCIIYLTSISAQQVVLLNNGSFERDGAAFNSKVPMGWELLAGSETPPDLLPNEESRVETLAPEGKYYLGLLVRSNRTTEAIGQRLNGTLYKDTVYQLRFMAARSPQYYAQERISQRDVNFDMPVIIRVYGGAQTGVAPELLAETPAVGHYEFKDYLVSFKPKANCNYLVFQAYYDARFSKPYNGHVLIDDISDIVQKLAMDN